MTCLLGLQYAGILSNGREAGAFRADIHFQLHLQEEGAGIMLYPSTFHSRQNAKGHLSAVSLTVEVLTDHFPCPTTGGYFHGYPLSTKCIRANFWHTIVPDLVEPANPHPQV